MTEISTQLAQKGTEVTYRQGGESGQQDMPHGILKHRPDAIPSTPQEPSLHPPPEGTLCFPPGLGLNMAASDNVYKPTEDLGDLALLLKEDRYNHRCIAHALWALSNVLWQPAW